MALKLDLFRPRSRRDDLVFIVSHSTYVACDSVIKQHGGFANSRSRLKVYCDWPMSVAML